MISFKFDGFFPVVCFLVFLCAFAYGWVSNVIGLIHCHDFSGLMVARVVGIFVAPLGAVLGYV